MQRIVLAIALAFCGVVAQADNVVINARRVSITSAQQDAALRNCCYYGRYRIVEKAVARGPRGWFAVIRYE